MSDKTVPRNVTTPQEITADPVLARVRRREALKGLGALAVSTTAFAAVGCSSEMTPAQTDGASTGASGSTAAPATTTASSATGASQAKPPASASTTSTPSMSASAPAGSAAAAGGAAPAASGASTATTPAMTAATSSAGSPAVGGMRPGASAAGTGAAGASAGGSAGAGAMAGAVDLSSLACILTPAQEDGPFFVEEKLNRSDLVKGETEEAIVKATPFALTIGVYKVNGMMCDPIPGLQVDIWHANANGIYSDVTPGFVQSTDTKGKQYLRGYQVTGESGLVDFTTIYPGWYPSRTIHIHFKIRMPMGNNSSYSFTSQMYFDEMVSKEVLSMGPYAQTPGTRMVFNADDHIFNGVAMNGQKPANGMKAPGLDTTVTLAKAGAGYTGMLKVGLKM